MRALGLEDSGAGSSSAEVVATMVGTNQAAYNSLWQLRADAWSSLEESTAQLALAATQQRPIEEQVETVTGLLNVLGPIERFWAFPGGAFVPGDAAAVRGR